MTCTFSLCSCSDRGKKTVSVLYSSYKDDYINSVRSNLDRAFADDNNINFQNYSADWDGTVQLSQVQEAIDSGTDILIVNSADVSSGGNSKDITELAKDANIPIIFFNRPVEREVVAGYSKCVLISIDYEAAGRMQGDMVGQYLLDNYELVDLNNDGKISYVMYIGEEDSIDAQNRAKYCIESTDMILAKEGKPAIEYYDAASAKGYAADSTGKWSSDFGREHMAEVLANHSETIGNMPEVVIAGNDAMALGAIEALKKHGYNTGKGNKSIPVFGIDATTSAQNSIYAGIMTGTVYQDSGEMADVIMTVMSNLLTGKERFDNIKSSVIEDNWKINIPLKEYRGRKNM
ncbi:MAG: substrate-binding domain-containing protein [Clostridia bacterium]|nr:substrate-binding domain-containing protein [Clostridia bacterium]